MSKQIKWQMIQLGSYFYAPFQSASTFTHSDSVEMKNSAPKLLLLLKLGLQFSSVGKGLVYKE
jgi:hypothetical protein